MNFTKEELEEMIVTNGIKFRKSLFKTIGIENNKKKKYELDMVLDRFGLLPKQVKLDTNKYTEEVTRGILIKCREELGHIPSSTEFNNLMERDRLPLRADSVRKYVFKTNKWSDALKSAFDDARVRKTGLSDEEMLEYLRSFVSLNNRLPLYEDLSNNPGYPCYDAYKERFGSLIRAIEMAGVADTVNNTNYGKLISHEGRIYKSKGECEIGRVLMELGIEFTQEPHYGVGNYKFDFYIPKLNLYIEYYGLAGRGILGYDDKILYKRTIYGDRKVLEIFPQDNIGDVLRSVVESSTTSHKA